ncbi:MAG: hypothetical protein IPK25_00255 [Saprospiraceae bacterium]|nr:hypothetical protein [Saprospiraceae bacterium]
MTYEKLAGEDLITLQKEKGIFVFLLLCLPTDCSRRGRQTVLLSIKQWKILFFARSQIWSKGNKRIITKLKDVIPTIDYDHNLDGIGFCF